MITNVSFDLWMTLIKSHPQFKTKRAELIADTYNLKGLSVSQIETITREYDKVFDRYNELNGCKISATEMYFRVLRRINLNSDKITQKEAEFIEYKSGELFLSYLPQFVNNEIPAILYNLIDRGISLNLASNTGYIERRVLKEALSKLDLLKYFSFCVFSDEINASKPSPNFFQEVVCRAKTDRDKILHIGDNYKTDYQGALNSGLKAFLITNTNYTFDDIANRL